MGGYGKSVSYIMESDGALFSTQAWLSLSRYPFVLKFIFTPLMDSVRF